MSIPIVDPCAHWMMQELRRRGVDITDVDSVIDPETSQDARYALGFVLRAQETIGTDMARAADTLRTVCDSIQDTIGAGGAGRVVWFRCTFEQTQGSDAIDGQVEMRIVRPRAQ